MYLASVNPAPAAPQPGEVLRQLDPNMTLEDVLNTPTPIVAPVPKVVLKDSEQKPEFVNAVLPAAAEMEFAVAFPPPTQERPATLPEGGVPNYWTLVPGTDYYEHLVNQQFMSIPAQMRDRQQLIRQLQADGTPYRVYGRGGRYGVTIIIDYPSEQRPQVYEYYEDSQGNGVRRISLRYYPDWEPPQPRRMPRPRPLEIQGSVSPDGAGADPNGPMPGQVLPVDALRATVMNNPQIPSPPPAPALAAVPAPAPVNPALAAPQPKDIPFFKVVPLSNGGKIIIFQDEDGNPIDRYWYDKKGHLFYEIHRTLKGLIEIDYDSKGKIVLYQIDGKKVPLAPPHKR